MHALDALRDVEGVFGSFVISKSGELLTKDLPAVFHDDVFVEMGPRIVRLCEAVEHGGEALESLVLRFADHKLHIRRSRGDLLCVICNVDSNAAALRMALSLVARRLGSSTELSVWRSEPPAPSFAFQPSSEPPLEAQGFMRSQRMYRGRPVE